MSQLEQTWLPEDGVRDLEPAHVESVVENGRSVVLELEDGTEGRARVPISDTAPPRRGDTVLVAGTGPDRLFVLGVLERARPPERRRIRGDAGAAVEVCRTERGERLRVVSNRGELLFDYDPETGRARLSAPTGGLTLEAPRGDISLTAGHRLRLEGAAVEVSARSSVALGVEGRDGLPLSSLRLRPRVAELGASEVTVTGQRGEVRFQELRCSAERFWARIREARCRLGRVERVATIVIEKTRQLYQTVKDLAQQRAGRVRTLVDGSYHVKSRTTLLSAEEDVKVQGERIHLG
jgi:hypothetical protein